MKTLFKLPLALLCLLLACQDDAPTEERKRDETTQQPDPELPVEPDPSDFFPMTEHKQWEYVYTYLDADSVLIYTEHPAFHIDGDTVIDGMTYKRFVNQNGILAKVARKDGDKYYGRNHELYGGFSHEYIFIDSEVPVGGSWEYLKNQGETKTEYIVKAIHETYTVSGVEFNNVLELETNYYVLNDETFILNFSTRHFYAAGLGEIYSYYPGSAVEGFTHKNVQIIGYISN